MLGALIDHAPPMARLEIAADAHLALKGAVAAVIAAGASSMTGDNVSALVNGDIDTKKATVFAVRAIYGRLEAARRAAAMVGVDAADGRGDVDKGVTRAQACEVPGEDSAVAVLSEEVLVSA